ncbi:hypothetical protein CPAR01_04000 [Colletotrichum paranaense]|uniref:Uncharacterized protein n=1 Tax=Colletotrichum paranaense TaxID=1914294 RepID=A0ABQ9SWA0_9PEZI|nr:uncharacterized protein CPAR01_04000 [Colletotrichum paranaense]KAK1543367.1 hypothetical protein CPAR01_04000 [Colletotrichum paranaense]
MPSVPEWPKECNPRRLVTQQHIRIPVKTGTSHSVPARTGVGRAKRQQHQRKLDHRFLSRHRRLTRRETILEEKQSICSPSVPGLVSETKTYCNSLDCRHMFDPSEIILLASKLQNTKLTVTLIDILHGLGGLIQDAVCSSASKTPLAKQNYHRGPPVIRPPPRQKITSRFGLRLAYLDFIPSTGTLYLVALFGNRSWYARMMMK